MEAIDLVILASAGLAGGFVGGLVGVGGGVIFAPVLFFFLQAQGVTDPVLTPLTIGSSLCGTLVTAAASALAQHGRGAVDWRTALATGLSSAVAVLLMTRLVTTRPWYDASVFQVVFALVLIWVGIRMFRRPPGRGESGIAEPVVAVQPTWRLAGIGTAAGTVSTSVGVGGGIVMVPAYHQLLGMPIHRSVGTSSGTIVLVALCGVLAYASAGWGAPVPGGAVGFVDVPAALVLSVPAAVAARFGVKTAHRFDTSRLQRAFAVLALLVAVRLVLRVLA